MRAALAFSLVLMLAACDSGAEPPVASSLVGVWEQTDVSSATLVTSRIDQSVPDLDALGQGGIQVTGAVTEQMRYVWFVDRQQASFQEVVFGTTPGSSQTDVPYVTFGASIDTINRQVAVLNWLPQGSDGPELRYESNGEIPFTYSEGRFSIPTATLRGADGSQVQVQGALTLPLVRLAAGVESPVRTASESTRARTITFTEGSYTETFEGEVIQTGTWRTGEDGLLELRPGGQPPDYSFQPRVTYQLDGATLRLMRTSETCTHECLLAYAANRFAPARSITRVRHTATEVYRRRP